MKKFVSALIASLFALLLVSPVLAQTYPLKGSPSLSYWMSAAPAWQARYKTLSDAPFGQGLVANTGVNITYTVAPANQAKESLNLMLASGELTDLIETGWLTMPGGPDKYIREGYILKLNDYLKKWAPNLVAYLKANPAVDRLVKTDEGSYYGFPFLRGGDFLTVFQGPIIRKDWLDELGLKVPETIDEWTVVLKAFKDKKGAKAPFAMSPYTNWGPGFGSYASPAFSGAYGALKDWYVENGKVKYGPYEPQMKFFYQLFATWYKDGLLDSNIALADQKSRDALFAAGQAGATIGNTAGGLGYLNTMVQAKDPKALFVAAPYPVLKKGDKPKFGQLDLAYSGQLSVAISAKLAKDEKKLEAAIRFLDWGYSSEGSLYYNFGTLGKSYTMVNGYPTYTEEIMKSKLGVAPAIADYARGSYNGPFIQDERYMEQTAATPEMKASIVLWGKTDMAKYRLPTLTPDAADISQMSKIMSEVTTYVAETFTKMVLGAVPVSDFDNYTETLKKLGIEKAIAIQQRAYDAFMKR
jgi:putative aldouronate transport system substrate-binding protein